MTSLPTSRPRRTKGRIHFHNWIGDSWAVLFSHPKDFTPVCTTELGYMARIKPEFDNRNTKIIGLSVDALRDHGRWVMLFPKHSGDSIALASGYLV
jgi:alkyl hydroperoxide reductase subunit AhpC